MTAANLEPCQMDALRHVRQGDRRPEMCILTWMVPLWKLINFSKTNNYSPRNDHISPLKVAGRIFPLRWDM